MNRFLKKIVKELLPQIKVMILYNKKNIIFDLSIEILVIWLMVN